MKNLNFEKIDEKITPVLKKDANQILKQFHQKILLLLVILYNVQQR